MKRIIVVLVVLMLCGVVVGQDGVESDLAFWWASISNADIPACTDAQIDEIQQIVRQFLSDYESFDSRHEALISGGNLRDGLTLPLDRRLLYTQTTDFGLPICSASYVITNYFWQILNAKALDDYATALMAIFPERANDFSGKSLLYSSEVSLAKIFLEVLVLGDQFGKGEAEGQQIINQQPTCTVSPITSANVRDGAGTQYAVVRSLRLNEVAIAGHQANDANFWWELENGGWVRYDTVDETGNCYALPRK